MGKHMGKYMDKHRRWPSVAGARARPYDATPMMARLGILISGGGSTYANLVRDTAGCALARGFGHPLVIAAEPTAVTAALSAHRVGWVAMCGWLKYWDPPPPFAGRTINIHPSLLPAFGGPGLYGDRVHAAVIAARVGESGCTVHLVAGGYDSGPVVAQSRVPVTPDDTIATLRERVQAAERDLYPRALAGLIAAAP